MSNFFFFSLLYNPHFLFLDPKVCLWQHAYKLTVITSFHSYFFWYCWSLIFNQFWQHTFFAPDFFSKKLSYFVHLNNKHKKDDVVFCPWSHSVDPNFSEAIFMSHKRFTLANLWPSIIVLQNQECWGIHMDRTEHEIVHIKNIFFRL